MQRRFVRPLLRSVAVSTRTTTLLQVGRRRTVLEVDSAPYRRHDVLSNAQRLRVFSTSTTHAERNDNDRSQSFSDAHFGQERDREEQRRKRRDATAAQQQASTSSSEEPGTYSEADHEHAVISTFDLFSIGIGPSSSHTVGPMRAGKIFVTDLIEASLLRRVNKIRISLYGSLAATGEGHMTPSALLLGLESADVETVETAYVPKRFDEIRASKQLHLAKNADDTAAQGGKLIDFDYEKDLIWEWGKSLPMHSNGMRLTVFDEEGTMLATNDMFSVGGGFVVNGALSTAASGTLASSSSPPSSAPGADTVQTSNEVERANSVSMDLTGHPADLAENMYYKQIRRSEATAQRRHGSEVRPSEANVSALPAPSSETQLPAVPGDPFSASSSSEPARSVADNKPPNGGPRFPFRDARSLLRLCKEHNLTIAQLVYDNERSLGYSDDEIRYKLFQLWDVMDNSIREGVRSTEDVLPGSLKLNRRAPGLYRRLTRGLYPSHGMEGPSLTPPPTPRTHLADGENGGVHKATDLHSSSSPPGSSLATQSTPRSTTPSLRTRGPPRVHGSFQHPLVPSPPRRTTFPAIDYLSVYAMAVNEVNAAGGRIVTAPTNGAAGVIPAVLKYTLEFQSDDAERDVFTFLLTAAAIGMLFKRGATISAAAGGCMAEVGVACSMAAGGFAACMGASPETIESAAEIGIEHNLGLTCDPIGGLVQAPCIERNALGAVKAIASANLALSSSGTPKVSLDDAIRAMRLTAQGMRNEFKETSLSGLATSVSFKIPVSEPDC